jgi:cyclin-dependent kinase 8/11
MLSFFVRTGEYAIKIFKPDENAAIRTTVVGISQSACRETSLCSELNHENIVGLEEIMADPLDKSIYMIFNYAEHDLLVHLCL